MMERLEQVEPGSGPGWWSFAGSAIVRCRCGFQAFLATSHEILDSGEVEPSLDCPECEFHEFVKLAGWAKVVERWQDG